MINFVGGIREYSAGPSPHVIIMRYCRKTRHTNTPFGGVLAPKNTTVEKYENYIMYLYRAIKIKGESCKKREKSNDNIDIIIITCRCFSS